MTDIKTKFQNFKTATGSIKPSRGSFECGPLSDCTTTKQLCSHGPPHMPVIWQGSIMIPLYR